MRKLVAMCLTALLAFSLTGCGGGEASGNTEEDTKNTPEVEAQSVPEKEGEGDSANNSGSGDLGDYHVEISGAALGQDYNGKAAVIFTYKWTNNSDKTTSAMVATIEKAFQDGVELDTAIIMGIGDNNMRDVRPGGTLDIQKAYLLNNSSSAVEFEISEFLSWSNEKVSKSFNPADLGAVENIDTTPAEAESEPEAVDSAGNVEQTDSQAADTPPVDTTGNQSTGSGKLGDYYVEITGAEIQKDYEGKNAIVITLLWTNNSDKTTSAMTSVIGKAFQDGVQLDVAIVMGTGENSMRDIRPGGTLEIQEAYLLNNSSSIVEFEVTEFLSWSGEMVTMNFNPAEL